MLNKGFVAIALGFFAMTCKVEQELPRGDSDNGGLHLPRGFEAVVVVDSIKTAARHIAVNSNGDIYVKARFAKDGGNAALRDENGDGRAEVVEIYGDYPNHGTYGTAMRVYNGYLYFSTELSVYRQKLTPGKLIPDSEIELVLNDDHQHGRHEHIAKPLTFDSEGNMYVPFGAPSNACQETNRTPNSPGVDPCPMLADHAGIWKFDANKLNQTQRDGKLFATGLRSVVALDWNHADNNLYAVQHGRDDLLRLWSAKFSPWQSAELPSEEFFRVTEGLDAGWPYCYYDQIKNKKVLAPEYGGDGEIVGRCAQYAQPLIGFPGHWAPNDILFYTGTQFPERYRNGAFIAFHGSTNRAPYPQAGYFIAFVPFINGQPGKWEVFADGFAGVDPIVNVSDAVYRPMGLAMGPDGSLYISDTEKGKIWRVIFKGERNGFSEEHLAEMEKRKMASNIRTAHEVNDNLDKDVAVGGEKVYEVYCGTCHQKNGLGDSGRFPPLANSPYVTGDKKRLIDIVLRGLSETIDVNCITYNGVMPQHSFLKDDEVARVLTYIRQNWGNKASEVTVEEVRQQRSATSNVSNP